jgi:GTP1/Obg family GTP-binding protein
MTNKLPEIGKVYVARDKNYLPRFPHITEVHQDNVYFYSDGLSYIYSISRFNKIFEEIPKESNEIRILKEKYLENLLDALDEQEKVVCSPKKDASNNV